VRSMAMNQRGTCSTENFEYSNIELDKFGLFLSLVCVCPYIPTSKHRRWELLVNIGMFCIYWDVCGRSILSEIVRYVGTIHVSVFRIRGILVRIRLRLLLFSSVTFKMPQKYFFLTFYACSFLKVHLYDYIILQR
jgi:hypothetical protein